MNHPAGLAVGAHIGDYCLVRLVGQGGMGAVYEALQVSIGRRVAVKILHATAAENQTVVARFLNEAKAISRISHPGLICVTELGQLPDGMHYLVMDFLEGDTLAKRLADQGPLPLPVALRLTRQIALAMSAAHGRHIYHRDLKPSNIMIVADPDVIGGERAKVVDFGIAKIAAGMTESTQPYTDTGMLLGTPLYMAPEQCSGAPVSDRTDVYSLGAMLFEMLCGRPPFPRQQSIALLFMHVNQEAPRLSSLLPEVDQALDELIGRMLAKLPATRPSMSEVAATVAHLGGEVAAAPLRRWGRHPRRALAGLGVLALLLGGSLLWKPWRPVGPRPVSASRPSESLRAPSVSAPQPSVSAPPPSASVLPREPSASAPPALTASVRPATMPPRVGAKPAARPTKTSHRREASTTRPAPPQSPPEEAPRRAQKPEIFRQYPRGREPGEIMRWAIVILCFLLASRYAWARPDGGPHAEARRHFTQGVELYNEGDFNGGLAEFETSYRLHPLPEVRFNIALTQKALFRYAEAIETLRQLLLEVPPPDGEQRRKIGQLLHEMEAVLAEVTITLAPAAAQLLIDGRPAVPGVLRLPAGHHQVAATAEGYQPWHREIAVSAGTPLRLELSLVALRRVGQVSIVSVPAQALAEIDGSRVGQTPLEKELAVGGYSLRLSAPGFRPYAVELVVGADQRRQVSVQLERLAPARSRWWLWTIGAVVLGGAAATIAATQLIPEGPLDGTLDPGRIRTVK